MPDTSQTEPQQPYTPGGTVDVGWFGSGQFPAVPPGFAETVGGYGGADVAALIGTPTAPPPGFVGPLPPTESPAPATQTGWGDLGGFFGAGSIFFRTRRVIRATRVTNMLFKLARVGLARVLEQAGGGIAMPPTGATLPMNIVQRGAPYLVGSSVIMGTLAMLYPRSLGSESNRLPEPGTPGWGNMPDLQLSRQMVANQKREEDLAKAASFLHSDFGSGWAEYIPPPRRSKLEQSIEDSLPQPLRDAIERSRGAQPSYQLRPEGGGALLQGPPLSRLQGPSGVPPPSTTSSSPPLPAGSSSQTVPGRTRGIAGVRWGTIAIGAGAIVAANALLPRVFASRSSGITNSGAPLPIIAGPANPVSTSPTVGSFAVSGFGGAGSAAYCARTPRGPRRKCLERAPVAWRSGQRKGKAAGTKCIRYATRRS